MGAVSATSKPEAFLDEKEIEITEWSIVAGGKRYPWNELGLVRIDRPKVFLVRLLTRDLPVYRLLISKKGKSKLKPIFVTQDAALVKRIEDAIGEVARRRGAIRER